MSLTLAQKLTQAFLNSDTNWVLVSFREEIEKLDCLDELEYYSGIKGQEWLTKLHTKSTGESALTLGEFKILQKFFNLHITVENEGLLVKADFLELDVGSVAQALKHKSPFHTDFWLAFDVTVEQDNEHMSLYSELNKSLDVLKETIIGQDDPLSNIMFNIYTNLQVITHNLNKGIPIPKKNLLIQGGTGTGKTFMMERIAKHLGIHYTYFNASELTSTGYVGKDYSDIIDQLGEAEGKTQLLFLDEFDKLCTNDNNMHTYGGQKTLLKILETGYLRSDSYSKQKGAIDGVDLGNVIIVLGGSFAIFEENTKRSNKPSIGFVNLNDAKSEELTEKDLIRAGIIPEIAGRIGQVVRLNKLNEEALTQILLYSREAIVKQFKMLAYYNGKTFSLTPKQIKSIIKESQELGLGVRGLSTLTEKVYIQQMLKGK